MNYKPIIALTILFFIISFYRSLNIWNEFLINQKEIVNPNTIAQNLMFCCLVFCIILDLNDTKRKNILIPTICIITAFGINNCNCRTAFISILIFLCVIIIPYIRRLISSNIKKVLCFLVISGIIIPNIYSSMQIKNIEILNNISNKNLYTGREIIWKSMINALNENKSGYIIGLGSHNNTNIGIILNYHTWYLGLLYVYGIPIFLYYYYYLICNISDLKKSMIKLTFIPFFLVGFFETSALWVNVQFMYFIILMLGGYEKTKLEK